MIGGALLLVFLALLVVAAVSDIWRMEIPNWISIVLAALFPVYAVVSAAPDVIIYHAVPAALVFAFGIALFAWGKFGGGDVKLITVAVLWLGLNALPVFLIALAVFGLVAIGLFIGLRRPLAALAARHLEARVGMPASLKEDGVIPYGTVIAAGAIVAVALAVPPSPL